MREKKHLRIGFLGFDRVAALDLIGPIDAFTAATIQGDHHELGCSYETVVIGLTSKPFTSESGVVFKPYTSLVAVWIRGHLRENLSVEALAERACLCPRQFGRVFKEVFATTPATFVLNLRLDETRRRLALPHQTIDSVAASAGFTSADAFRRAFERRFGVTPSSYRNRFGIHSMPSPKVRKS